MPTRAEPLAGTTHDRWAERRIEHSILRITPEALEIATPEQWMAIGQMLRAFDLRVNKGGFDLPGGYLEFHYGDASIYGGIAPDGAVST